MQSEKAILLFDGVCNLCNRADAFIAQRDKKNQFRFVALQSEEGKEWRKHFQIPDEIDSVILIEDNSYYTQSDAVLQSCKYFYFPWKLCFHFRLVPKTWRDVIYTWVARNRYRWFGKENCGI